MNKPEVSEKYLFVERSKAEIFWNNVLGGIAWGIGSVVGATLIVGIIGYGLSRAESIPFVGDIIESIVKEISESGFYETFQRTQ